MLTDVNQHKRRARQDVIVLWIITSASILVLVLLLMLVWHLLTQTSPLAAKPKMAYQSSVDVDNSVPVYVGDIFNNGHLIVQNSKGCGLDILNYQQSRWTSIKRIVRPCSHELIIIESQDEESLLDISGSGQVRLFSIDSLLSQSARGLATPELSFGLPQKLWQERVSLKAATSEGQLVIAVIGKSGANLFYVSPSLPEKIKRREFRSTSELYLLPSMQWVLTIDANRLNVLNADNQLLNILEEDENISDVFPLTKERTLFTFTESMQLSRWVLSNTAGVQTYQKTFTLDMGEEQVVSLRDHPNVNALLALTSDNRFILMHRITGQVLASLTLPGKPDVTQWRGNELYASVNGELHHWRIENMSGVETIDSLFNEQTYEGYSKPQHLYQTAAADDYYESKYAIVPLLIGSLKIAFGALFVAIPLALGSAVYTGYYASQKVRARLKPVIEILEAVPSVVIGFIVAIVIIPMANSILLGLALFLFTLPCLIVAGIFLLSRKVLQHHFATALLLVLFWGGICMMIASVMADLSWLSELNTTTLLVSIALGIAIAPTVYSLTDDAIDGVPASIKNASFALGASQVETLNLVVLRVALPGLIAAIMLGFGRAFGETMIVLMVTGNTPIADWDMFESVRTLTANIAIELPEAEPGTALYSILFLTATILFVFTFVLNTLAEWLKHIMRLRVKDA